jgi:hypothetical protein
MGSFDTATECDAKRDENLQGVLRDLKARHRDKIPASQLNCHDDGWDITLLNETCVAIDDPRLKGN